MNDNKPIPRAHLLQISEQLEQWTAAKSGFETSRTYVSLSHAWMRPDELLKTYTHGFEDSHLIRLRCYKGYQMERDMIHRLVRVFGSRLSLAPTITAFNNLVQGHPEGEFDEDYYFDCKSVPLDAHLPETRLPSKVFHQMQAYTLYGKRRKAIVIYESRESGIIRDYLVTPVRTVQARIDENYKTVVQQILKQNAA